MHLRPHFKLLLSCHQDGMEVLCEILNHDYLEKYQDILLVHIASFGTFACPIREVCDGHLKPLRSLSQPFISLQCGQTTLPVQALVVLQLLYKPCS